jgi:spermidine synthase
MAALIYEVSWIRPISSVYRSTIYAISIILTSFMLGLALGSRLIGKFVDRVKRPLLLYSLLQFGIALYGLLLLSIFNILPMVFNKLLLIRTPFHYFLIQFFSVFFLLLIPTTLMGATFPTISKSYIKGKIGKGIGEIYSINNLGAIVGSLSAGFILIPFFGIRYTIMIAALLNLFAGFFILLYFYPEKLKLFVPIILILFLTFNYCGKYDLTNLYTGGFCGFFEKDLLGDRKILFYEEGMYGYVAIMQEGSLGEIKRLLLNGQGSSSLRLNDVRVSTLLGYLPMLVNPDLSNSLVIGFGTGATSNILSRHMKTVTVEIEPKVIETSEYFKMINEGVFNENHKIVYDDARHYLLKTNEKYDIIVNHPLEPYQSFSSLLFTKEFFEIVESRLNDDGLYVQWFPVYDLKPGEFRDFYKTFDSVFPYQIVFVNLKEGEMIDYVLEDESGNKMHQEGDIGKNSNELIIIGSKQPIKFNLEENFDLLTEYDKDYLAITSLDSPEKISNLLFFKGEDIKDYYRNADFITDDKPILEFSTPITNIKKLSKDESPAMDDILRYIDFK